jgi:hypothetical protein
MFRRARSTTVALIAAATFVAGVVGAHPAAASLFSSLSGPGPEVAISNDGSTLAFITNGIDITNAHAAAGSIVVRHNGYQVFGAPNAAPTPHSCRPSIS